MDFDIKAKIEELVKKITGDKSLLEKFTKDPIAAIKSLLGGVGLPADLPTDQLEGLVSGVQAKLNLDEAGGVGGILGKIGGIFGGKK